MIDEDNEALETAMADAALGFHRVVCGAAAKAATCLAPTVSCVEPSLPV